MKPITVVVVASAMMLSASAYAAAVPPVSNQFITIDGKEVSLEPPTTDVALQHLNKRCLPFCLLPLLAIDKKKNRKDGPVREYTIDAKGRLCHDSHRPAVGTCFAQRYKGYHHYCVDAAHEWAAAARGATGGTQSFTMDKNGKSTPVGQTFSFKNPSYKDGVPGRPIDPATAPLSGYFADSSAPKVGKFIPSSGGKGITFDDAGNPIWSTTGKPVNQSALTNQPITVGDKEVHLQDGVATWAATGKPVNSSAIEGGIIKIGGHKLLFDDSTSVPSAVQDEASKASNGANQVGKAPIADGQGHPLSGVAAPSTDATAVFPIGTEISKSADSGTFNFNGLPSAETLASPDSKNVGMVDYGSEPLKADGKMHRKLIPRRAAGSAQQD
ncbi:hypothetical protein B0A48_17822 [Cryoendolithus antarcticus]|uniref:Uncharacterized protein n=1 Tax=Cryoendolithus antarcticus TaxID=1507870 RepID=A0A1V8SBG1_9PEZI|nr:hypothetical protein B0A48_17822 [Cryoendolithus antarcticus]